MSTSQPQPLLTQPFRWLRNFLAKYIPKPIQLYWSAYGGSKALFKSPYLIAAFAFAAIMTPSWLELDKDGSRTWAQLPLSILPNILGFSMGGMAIMLAFAGSRVFIHMTEEGKEHSYFIKIIASFYHFILAQTIALFFGLFCRSYSWWPLSFFGYASMCYAMLVALATAAQIFNTARIANFAATIPEDCHSAKAQHTSTVQDHPLPQSDLDAEQ